MYTLRVLHTLSLLSTGRIVFRFLFTFPLDTNQSPNSFTSHDLSQLTVFEGGLSIKELPSLARMKHGSKDGSSEFM